MPSPYYPPRESGWAAGFSPDRHLQRKAFQSGGAGMAGTAGEVIDALDTRWQTAAARSSAATSLTPASQTGRRHHLRTRHALRLLRRRLRDPCIALNTMAKGAVQWGGVYGNTWLVDARRGSRGVTLQYRAGRLHGCVSWTICAGRCTGSEAPPVQKSKPEITQAGMIIRPRRPSSQ